MKFHSRPYQPPQQDKIDYVYVDEFILLVNKLPGLLTVPGKGASKQDCLISRVQVEYDDALIVHRLDMATSGLVLIARGKAMQRKLSILFQNRMILKKYRALLHGILPNKYGLIDLPIIVDWPNKPIQQVDYISGKVSQTYYELKATDLDRQLSLVELTPYTGRTHQLRLHMQAIGYAIVGDRLYREQEECQQENNPINENQHLLLHASGLSFLHPETEQRLVFCSKAKFNIV